VFTPDRSGFDAMIGNPPWDVLKPNSQEFFTDFDPLYRTYDKQAALRKQSALFEAIPSISEQWDEYNARFKSLANWARSTAYPFDLTLARGNQGSALATVWAKHRLARAGFADPEHPFRLQGSADLNSYKMFAEVFWNLLRPDGRLGVILPAGIYSDFGTKDLREALLFRGRIDLLYAFQNEKRVFSAAHHAFKQVALFVTRGGKTESFRTRFRMGVGDSPEAHEIPDDILRGDSAAIVFTPDDVRTNSPKTLGFVELKSDRDLSIFRKVFAHSIRIGDNAPGWEITYAREFDTTNDSKHFPPLEKWEAKGYRPDVFGRWIGPEGDVALPLYEGRMIGHFDFWQKGWVEGKGRTAVWREIPFDNKAIQPQYLMADTTAKQFDEVAIPTFAYMRVSSATNTRTILGTYISRIPSGDSVFHLRIAGNNPSQYFVFQACLSSFCLDYAARPRVGGLNMSWYIMEDLPIPKLEPGTTYDRLTDASPRLTLLHRRFAPEWLKLKQLHPELASKEWKHWWAVTVADRLRLRVEIDALCADLYGLDPDDFDWILRDDRTDPKGFYRVDRQLPFRERLTGLAAAAFRALKEGKWSAESAASLSNDEFFDLLGIPELTSARAAHAKGLPGPLIAKRDGCHAWHPENFPEDDPRHGWTWDDCWNDAVALLGSEEAVREYIGAETSSKDEEAQDGGGEFRLQSNDHPRQRRIF
jgi:hypothetical protein